LRWTVPRADFQPITGNSGIRPTRLSLCRGGNIPTSARNPKHAFDLQRRQYFDQREEPGMWFQIAAAALFQPVRGNQNVLSSCRGGKLVLRRKGLGSGATVCHFYPVVVWNIIEVNWLPLLKSVFALRRPGDGKHALLLGDKGDTDIVGLTGGFAERIRSSKT